MGFYGRVLVLYIKACRDIFSGELVWLFPGARNCTKSLETKVGQDENSRGSGVYGL